MKRKLNDILPIICICALFMSVSTSTAFAAPEDYVDEFQNGVNGALDDAETYLDDIWNDVSGAIDDTVNDVRDYVTATEPETATESDATTNDDYYYNDEEIYEPEPTEPPTEPPTEEVTTLYAPTENEDYDYYSYEPPTEPPTEVYEPEILTETYTDAPFMDRFALTDAEEGNLFIALGLWIAIAIGVIIVISVVHTTHKRKKGDV